MNLNRPELGQVLEEVVVADLRFHRGELSAERRLQTAVEQHVETRNVATDQLE
jgi:hypothetical protein